MKRTGSTPRLRLALAALALGAAACGPSDADLRGAVRAYASGVIEAYRTSDSTPVHGITGADEERRITALIGVKRDAGVTMDAHLLELRFGGIERRGGEYLVSTEERWRYEDRRIGGGAPAGPETTDRYWMQYHLRREGKRLVVERADFARPPELGSRVHPGASWDVMHGVFTRSPGRAVPDEAPPGAVLHGPAGASAPATPGVPGNGR